MTAREFSALGKRLLPRLPGFAAKGQMLFIRPVGHTLRGIFFDRSINSRAFYVQIFIQPLFVPAEHIEFNVGWRLGGDCHVWNADAPGLLSELDTALKQEALPFLANIQSPRDTASAAKSLQKSKDPYVQQAIAYGFARGGDVGQAIAALAQLVRMFNVQEQYPWQQEMAERAQALAAELRDNPLGARARLEAWEAETAKKLVLEKFD